MNYKAMIKKQSTIIAIAVICLTIATLGVSYALFFQVETNTNNQIVEAGTLNVSYGSGSSSITATEFVPMSDDEALSTNTMTGTIYVENKGTLPAIYEIALGNDIENFNKRENASESDKLLSHDYIRIAAYVNGELKLEPTTLSSLTMSENSTDAYKLFEGILDVSGTGNSAMTIVLKIWIDEEAPESIIGDFVYLKMDVTSEVDERIYITTNGTSPLTFVDSIGQPLVNYKIYGKSIQETQPTPTSPVEVESVGDYDEESGKYVIPITVRGKNLLNIDDLLNAPSGTLNNYTVKNLLELQVKPNTTYTLSSDGYGSLDGAGDTNRCLYFHGTSTDNAVFKDKPVTITTGDTGVLKVLLMSDRSVAEAIKNKEVNIQLEEGDTATEYEPYRESKSAQIYLDAPLRNFGSYSDYLDFENKAVYRRIKVGTLVGDSTDGYWSTVESGKYFVNYKFSDAIYSGNVHARDAGYTNYFPNDVSYGNVYDGTTIGFYWSSTQFRISWPNQFTTKAELQAWLKEINANGQPLRIHYVMKNYSDPEPVDLPDIPTVKGTNILEVNTKIAPSDIVVSYK